MATTLAKRLEKAATDFPGALTFAWVQYHAEGGTVGVRMIAPEVMKEYRGSVKSGTGGSDKFVTGRFNWSPILPLSACLLLPDAKGILFFDSRDDLDIVGPVKVRNNKYPVAGSTTKVVVETEFGSPGQGFEAFARFVAEVDTKIYPSPDFNPGAIGTGQIKNFDVVTCNVVASRVTTTVNIGGQTINKEAHFTSQANTRFSQSGIMFFPNMAWLKSKPDGQHYCVANYSPDRILFHIENEENEAVAVFIPDRPIVDIGPSDGTPRVTWETLDDGNVVETSA
ncbi:hypothetical protein F5888DRAFT_560856 [Russula emetica]|nr:hypothetical protein F5888DRAFT_560856 [Russula emetica]